MKLDRFTWIIIAAIVALLIAAVVSVNRATPDGEIDYLTDDSPDTPIYNVFLALEKEDVATARRYYAEAALAEMDKADGYDPLNNYRPNGSQRLRIINVSIDEAEPDRAYVTVAIDTYANNGLFGSGSTYSREQTIEVVREDGEWKIADASYFYY